MRITAIIATVAGAIGSLALMLRVGRNAPMLLIVLFTGWVLLPFAILFAGAAMSRAWSASRQAFLHTTMLIVTLASLSIYGFVAAHPEMPRPASSFLMVPLVSLFGIAMAGLFARKVT